MLVLLLIEDYGQIKFHSENGTGRGLAGVDYGPHEVDGRGENKHWQPSALGLGDQFGGEWAAQNARDGGQSVRDGEGDAGVVGGHVGVVAEVTGRVEGAERHGQADDDDGAQKGTQ